MITTARISTPKDSVPAWHAQFLAMLPAIQRHARVCFRHLSAEAKEEAVQEAIANALAAYCRLVQLGREDVAYAGPLARYAVAQIHAGRRVGGQLNVRDVMSKHCRLRKGVVVERFDHFDDRDGGWQEAVVEDRRATPADVAAARIDIAAWLRALSGPQAKHCEGVGDG